ncbi:hypothetical protein IAR55_005853 [Kwoniella newhampshirensis]|uniref:RING-type domain-containing protein n=1 Tax=Kwoniella newhampshirensis TaxID=1651941 RepID=A0AAW0YVI4_9TREE
MLSPAHVPLPSSPSTTTTSASRRSSTSSTPYHPSPLSSPLTHFAFGGRPRLDRNQTSATIRKEVSDPFREGSTISVNQPVGSISISPSSRDVCLASRKGLYILDLAELNNAPRFIPQGGTWQIADVQWSPHPATSNLILSTSSQKLLVWDLAAQRSLFRSIDAHARAITDINWHALNPNLMATVAMDAGIRGWDLRCWDKPFMRLCAWGAAGTQVKWNRRHDHIVATSHGKVVHIWDDRKGSVPVTSIKAHDAKIYGIDWDRKDRHKLVTCSLDKTIKYWTVPELGSSSATSHSDFHSSLRAPDTPTAVISTSYPVWRARNLPFGQGVLSLPQRGEKALEMFGMDDNTPVERFEGHENVVKDFVWRTRGGEDPSFDDREFQLVTWSKDRTLRIWPIGKEATEAVGFQYGKPIDVLVSRRGAPNITYTKDPSNTDHDAPRLPPPVVQPSNLTRQKLSTKPETGMTRGGNRVRGIEQLEWLTKVVKNAPSPDSSSVPSRMTSVSRTSSRPSSVEGRMDWISLKDEVVLLSKMFPRPRINFEKIDLAHHKLTMSMQGPWANGDRMAFMRIHWSFPANYPYGNDIPTFELERNPTVSPITRQMIVTNIKEMRAHNKQCLVATTGYLLGSHERLGRRRIDEESDSESEKGVETTRLGNVPMLIRTCGATFGPNGQLVCFFPKQVVLPRVRNISRSPSITRDSHPSPMLKAISALARLQNPHKRSTVRYKPRIRKLDQQPILAPHVQAGSTMTIHDASHFFGQPSAALAKVYSMSLESNIYHAVEAKRLDHAEAWSTLKGVLADPPPAYSALPPVHGKAEDQRRERAVWEKSMARKKRVLDQLYTVLIAARDVQMLALVSCILLDHVRTAPVPPQPESLINRSPEQDYFTLPRVVPAHITPTRHRASSSIPLSPGNSSYYRTSGWSQILNPSGISLRGALTPKDRSSFNDLPFSKTPLGMSYEDGSPTGLAIPPSAKKLDSPKIKERPRFPTAASASPPPPLVTPLKSSGTDRSLGSSSGPRSHQVSFGSASPLGAGRALQRTGTAHTMGTASGSNAGSAINTPGAPGTQTPNAVAAGLVAARRRARTCQIKLDFPRDESPTPSLLPDGVRPTCEAWKLAYADFLLRAGLLGVRANLMTYEFVPNSKSAATKAASGEAKIDARDGARLEGLQSVAHVCVACASQLQGSCPSCNQGPKRPMCSFCRLPIKGLSMGCATCTHKLHAKCFQSYFLSPITTPLTCPACPCSCLAHKGISTPYFAFNLSPKQSPSVTRGFARGSITPVALPPEEGSGVKGRVTYASLAKLGAIKENLGSSAGVGALGLNPDGGDDGQNGAGSSGVTLPADRERERERERTQSRDGRGSEGLLSRARRGGEGLLHWKGTVHNHLG